MIHKFDHFLEVFPSLSSCIFEAEDRKDDLCTIVNEGLNMVSRNDKDNVLDGVCLFLKGRYTGVYALLL